MAYEKIYPDLFIDKEEISRADISSQFVYPEFLYNIQAKMLKRYHNIQPDVLYRGDDVWDIATHNTSSKVHLQKQVTDNYPYYTMVKTTDSDKSRLGLVLPFTPYEKQNITAYIVGTYENGNNSIKVIQISHQIVMF